MAAANSLCRKPSRTGSLWWKLPGLQLRTAHARLVMRCSSEAQRSGSRARRRAGTAPGEHMQRSAQEPEQRTAHLWGERAQDQCARGQHWGAQALAHSIGPGGPSSPTSIVTHYREAHVAVTQHRCIQVAATGVWRFGTCGLWGLRLCGEGSLRTKCGTRSPVELHLAPCLAPYL